MILKMRNYLNLRLILLKLRVPSTSIPTKIANLMARSPPFHLLLDHTIAVVWLLFAKRNYDCPLGINQLQWALTFLKTIQTRSGDYPEDINVCINAIEELLVKEYAELQDEIDEASRLDETINYGGGALNKSIRRVLIKPAKGLIVNIDKNLPNRLPILQHKPKIYQPMPYVFRVPSTSIPTKIANLMARSPPFHLLLDHTIAVVWLLFAKRNYDCPLGINQLQWALTFLKTIQTRSGDYPEDINVCINAIEELLVKEYAELQDEIDEASRLDETINYGGGALNKSNLVTEKIPFSINYSEMLNRSLATSDAQDQVHEMTSLECEEELEKLKKAAGVKSIELLDSKSKDKAINVLKILKTGQVEKVRGELRKLRSIEDMMKDIDINYVEDDSEGFLKCE